jgi:thiol-disulfide isomerase/thioredoxin
MNMKNIITTLLALVAMAGQGQTIEAELADTYWRNETTGDWEIGFTDSCAIYDCQLWKYSHVKEKGGKFLLTINNGNKTLSLNVGKLKDGKRQMTIGNGKKQTYSNITTRRLPFYPQPDPTPFKDNGFREGDSATVIGWIKDHPELAGKSINLEVQYGGFLTGYRSSFIEATDANGFFTIKVPIENTQTVFISGANGIYMDPIVEPGDTCFILHDEKNDKILYMGRNARVMNEFWAGQFEMVFNNNPFREDRTAEEILAFADQCKEVYRQNEAKLDSVLAKHPTLSRKYEDCFRMLNLTRRSFELLMACTNSDNKLPQAEIDSMLAVVRKNIRKPYSLWYEFNDFPGGYLQYAIFTTPRNHGSITLNKDFFLQLEKEGWLTLSEEMLDKIEKEEFRILFRSDAIRKALNDKVMAEGIKWDFNLADSIFTDPVLRECAKANRVYGMLDATNQPLNKYYLEAANNIQLSAARNAVLAKNEAIITLQNKPMKFTGLRPSSDGADMTDGEKILRKLIEPYKGKYILLDIWGTWCGPCKAALAHSQEEYERLKDYNLVYLYLANNSSDDSWKNVIKMYDVTGDNVVHYNLPRDQQSVVEQYLNVQAFPYYKLIGRDGTILDADADPRNLDKLAHLLEQLKNKQEQ